MNKINFLLIAISLTFTGCGEKEKKPVQPAPTEQAQPQPLADGAQERNALEKIMVEGCTANSTPPYNTVEVCTCMAKGTVQAMVNKCGGNETHVNYPCELSDDETSSAVSHCFSQLQ